MNGRLTRGDTSVSVLEVRITQLERAQLIHQDQLAEVQLHVEDLENWSRQNNLRIRGLQEATGPENLLETVRAILHRILEPDPPANLEFDRVHRALGPKPVDPEHPRDVICHLHRYTQKSRL